MTNTISEDALLHNPHNGKIEYLLCDSFIKQRMQWNGNKSK